MSTVTVSFQGTDKIILDAIEASADQVSISVIGALDEVDTQMQAWIVSSELHGQVLRQVSGKLAGSIRAIPAQLRGGSVVGSVEGAGGPAWYGALFENGGTGPFDIHPDTAKALRFEVNGEVVFAKVVHHPGIPSRPFMAPALEHFTPTIVAAVEAAIHEGLGG